MNEKNEQRRGPERPLPYETLLESAGALLRMRVVVCPNENCKRSATIERQADGTVITRYHAEGQLDSVTELLGAFKPLVITAAGAYNRSLISTEPCPEHTDHYDRLLEAQGIVVGPDDTRTPRQIVEDLAKPRSINPF